MRLVRKGFLGLCLLAAASNGPIGPLPFGAEPAVAEDCKPKMICEEINLVFYRFEICWKIYVTDC